MFHVEHITKINIMKKAELVEKAKEQIAVSQGAVQIVNEADLITLRVRGQELKDAVISTGEKYLALCMHIRKVQMPPRLVSEELSKLGFVKQRITEINRVAQCGDEVWNEFEARALSFRKVLAIERGSAAENVAGKSEAANGGGDSSGEDGSAGDGSEPSLEERKATAVEKMARAAKTILHAAADLELRSKQWTIGNGYILKLQKDKASKGAKEVK